MKFTDLFIRRPVLATVVNLFLLIAGYQSIRALTVRQYPRTDNAVVTVSVAYPGANADVIESQITELTAPAVHRGPDQPPPPVPEPPHDLRRPGDRELLVDEHRRR